jgi:hypothetical protein
METNASSACLQQVSGTVNGVSEGLFEKGLCLPSEATSALKTRIEF